MFVSILCLGLSFSRRIFMFLLLHVENFILALRQPWVGRWRVVGWRVVWRFVGWRLVLRQLHSEGVARGDWR